MKVRFNPYFKSLTANEQAIYKAIKHIGNGFFITSQNQFVKSIIGKDNISEEYLGVFINTPPTKLEKNGWSLIRGYIEKFPTDYVNVFCHDFGGTIMSALGIDFTSQAPNPIIAQFLPQQKTVKVITEALFFQALQNPEPKLFYFDPSLYTNPNVLYDLALLTMSDNSYPYFENLILKYRCEYKFMIPSVPNLLFYKFNEYKFGGEQNVIMKATYKYGAYSITVREYVPRFLITKDGDTNVYKYDKNNDALINVSTKDALTFQSLTQNGNTFDELLELIINKRALLDSFTNNSSVIWILTNGYIMEFYISHEYFNLTDDEWIHVKNRIYDFPMIKGLL